MNKKRILALCLTVLMIFSCTACSVELVIDVGEIPAVNTNVGATQVPTPTQPTVQPTQPPVTEQTNPNTGDSTGITPAPTEAVPTTPAPTEAVPTTPAPTEAVPTTPAPTEPQASGMPTSKEDVVKYYCTAYNKIGTEASAVTRTYDYTSNYNNILNINNNSTLEGIASKLMNQFMVETKEPLASDASSLPPVGMTTLNIDPSLISEAVCTDKGDHYEVVLKSTGTDDNYEVDSQVGVGSAGSIGPLLRTEDVSGAAGSLIKFDGLHVWYATASVTAKIDKATGRITELAYLTPCILHFDQVVAAIVVKVQNCDIGLLFQQNYTIAY